ncbi:MAG: hypothetical protein FWE40_07230 [Oscillospiraceae bacterium]|jgi:hypothetical protein|nr:hypothetical protein [Oscillospiraceae bacterium]
MKKLLAVLLAMLLLAGMGVPALAVQPAYTYDDYIQENDETYVNDTRPDWWINFFDNVAPRLGGIAGVAGAIAGILMLLTVLMRGLQFVFGADVNVWIYAAISAVMVAVITVLLFIIQ